SAVRARADTVVARTEGARSVYANASRTHRRGPEVSLQGELDGRWRYALAATVLDARDEDTGRRLAGTALRTGWAELRWSPRGHGDADALDLFVAASGNSRIA